MPTTRIQWPKAAGSLGRNTIMLLLLAHLLAVVVLAALPQLHETIHADAGHEDHQCAVTLYQHGGYSDALPDAIPVGCLAWAPLAYQPPVSVWVPSPYLLGSILERAPPSGLG